MSALALAFPAKPIQRLPHPRGSDTALAGAGVVTEQPEGERRARRLAVLRESLRHARHFPSAANRDGTEPKRWPRRACPGPTQEVPDPCGAFRTSNKPSRKSLKFLEERFVLQIQRVTVNSHSKAFRV